MKKRWITAALALSLCFSTQGITYAASTTKTVTGTQEISYAKKSENKNIVTGKLENKNQSWTYNKKTHTLTIKGTGKLDVLYFKIPEGSDLDEGEAEIVAPWDSYTTDITSVVIEDGITSVGSTRFNELPNLKKITLGKGIKQVTRNLFSETKVREVVIPDTVTTIEKDAFKDCDQITNITLGAGITFIDKDAFNCSYNLKTISLSQKNKSFSFENGILMDKAHTTVYLALGDENHTVTIPSTVKYINPPGLEHPEIEQIVVDENNSCYASIDGILYSRDLKTLYLIPAAYKNSTIVLPTELEKTYDICIYHIFDRKASNVSKIVFGEKTDATLFIKFTRWNSRKEPSIYLDVTKNENFSVVDGAVYDKEMTTLYVYQGTGQEYVMPDTVVDLYEYGIVFPKTCSLTSITLGANFKSDSTRLNAATVQSIQVSTQNAIYSSVNGMLYSKDQTACILCPQNYGKNIVIPEGTKEIQAKAFSYMEAETITLPSTLEEIGFYSFYELHGLKNIEIPSHAKVSENSFYICKDLETVIWNSQKYSYGAPFYDCPNLTSPTIGPDAKNFSHSNLQVVDGKTLATSAISTITLDEKNPNYIIKNDFLLDKTGKTLYAYLADYDGTLKLPKGVTTIGSKAFTHSRNLKQVILPNSLETIGTKAFFKSREIKTITFPKKVSKIGKSSFFQCKGL